MVEESYWERMKRYGTAYTFEESLTQFLFHFDLPEKVPEHPWKYRLKLPDRMPDYKFEVKLMEEGQVLWMKAWLEDPNVKRLCGVANSFPDRFLRELYLPARCKGLKHNYNPQTKVLDIIVDKV